LDHFPINMKTRAVTYLYPLSFLAFLSFSSNLSSQEFVKSDFAVSDESEYLYEAPELSVNNAGDMVVVWETSGSGDIWFRIISSSGEQMGPIQEVDTPNTTTETRIIHNDIGNFMIIYGANKSYWYILGQTYSSDGVAITDTMVVDRSTTEMINFFRSSLNSNREGHFAAFLPGRDSMIVEMFSASGEYLSNPVVLKTEAANPMEMYGIMTYSDELILVWMDGANGDLRGRRYSAEGTPIGDEFQVSYKEDACCLSNARISADTAGNFAIGWTSTLNGRITLFAQLFDKEGISIGRNIIVTDDSTSFRGVGLSMDMDADGNFVLAWPDSRRSDTTFIYMQQVDALGVPVGGNFRATTINNQTSPGMSSLPHQDHPNVRLLRDTIYLTWSNYNEDIHYRDIIVANIQKWQIPDVTGLPGTTNSAESISVYPNPSPGSFTLQLSPEIMGDFELSLYNSAGGLVHQSALIMDGHSIRIDLPDMQEGIYYLKVRGGSYQIATPLIIKK